MINDIGKSTDEAGQSLHSFHDHWRYLDQFVGLQGPVDQCEERLLEVDPASEIAPVTAMPTVLTFDVD